MKNFDRRAEAMWPDTDTPGWNVVQLECGHLTYQPVQNTNRVHHCGDCMLDHEAHNRKIAAINKKLADEQRAAVALADTVFEDTYGPEENPF